MFWSRTFWGPGPWKEHCTNIGPYVPFEVPIYGNSGTVLFRVLDLQGNINVGRKTLKFFEPRANSAGGGEDAGRLRICKCFGLESGPWQWRWKTNLQKQADVVTRKSCLSLVFINLSCCLSALYVTTTHHWKSTIIKMLMISHHPGCKWIRSNFQVDLRHLHPPRSLRELRYLNPPKTGLLIVASPNSQNPCGTRGKEGVGRVSC